MLFKFLKVKKNNNIFFHDIRERDTCVQTNFINFTMNYVLNRIANIFVILLSGNSMKYSYCGLKFHLRQFDNKIN